MRLCALAARQAATATRQSCAAQARQAFHPRTTELALELAPATEVSQEVLGEYALMGKRMSAGAMLGMMDLCAVRGAHKHVQSEAPHDVSYVTVAVDACHFLGPILHGDMVRIEATPVLTGASSITVDMVCRRRSLRSRQWEKVQQATFTIVTVCKTTLKSAKVVPALAIPPEYAAWQGAQDAAVNRRRGQAAWAEERKRMQRLVEEEGRADEVLEAPPAPWGGLGGGGGAVVSVEGSKVVLRKMFLPKSLNFNQTVFGGDLLKWMEEGSLYCAMNFVGHRDVITISMNRVSFKKPITLTDWVTLEAQVVLVTKHTLHVSVRVSAEAVSGEGDATHEASFVVMSQSLNTGKKQPVSACLSIPSDDLEARQEYHHALQRYKDFKADHKMKDTVNAWRLARDV